jgi:tRNA uridine 5-carboxymethylaminomethyl modification enzyme
LKKRSARVKAMNKAAAGGYDVVVIGGGHAGCEAAHAAARMMLKTALVTMDKNNLAFMSCNPAIGGLAKGQLVREVDSLGGLMGVVTDRSMVQFRMLNTKKGPAVRSPRAQCDRAKYTAEMVKIFEHIENCEIIEGTVEHILAENSEGAKRVRAVRLEDGREIACRAAVLTAGTFLRGLMHIGFEKSAGGRRGEKSAEAITASLEALGFETGRLKTGTPPRLDGATIDYSKCKPQNGDPVITPFSFGTEKIEIEQMPCYITYSNASTHEIIRANLDRSPLYSGVIKGVGPRYCPSIEDKVVKFPGKDRHQIFLEPEGRGTSEVYANGISSSLPKDVQEKFVRSIPGLENVRIAHYAYAVEYDFFQPTQLFPTLETKLVKGLYFAGQVNGTSGYEEAAAQGIIAGANAACALLGKEPVVLGRHEAYAGVLIDDLVTLGTNEPYRMFTSRAEYRLLLRSDNADRRLRKYGHHWGTVSDAQMKSLETKEKRIAETLVYMKKTRVGGTTLEQLLKRPENDFYKVAALDKGLADMKIDAAVREQVEIEIKYAGYIARQEADIERMKNFEDTRIPDWVDYSGIGTLRRESREKLAKIRPRTIGQASRISGVSGADVAMLMVHIRGRKGRG